jgi:hypothetical protein
MNRLFKPARSKECGRGFFSYLTESVINMVNFVKINGHGDIIYYHDLHNLPGYVKDNSFDVAFIQNTNDYKKNIDLYDNIENTDNVLDLDCYNPLGFSNEVREISEKIVKNYFKFNETLNSYFVERHREIDFEKTVGVHRRSTDIKMHHNKISLQTVFYNIEKEEFDNIFLMCDNSFDTEEFKKRYGKKIITYDEFTSNDQNLPFFKLGNNQSQIENHILELVFGVFTLSKTKKLICTKSNLSSFAILINKNLKYNILT